MITEEAIVCPLERPMSPRRKAALYLAVGSAIGVCIFFFFIAWVALFS